MSSYYRLLNRQQQDNTVVARFAPNIHAEGAWNPNEQHMAPATGVLCAELERYLPREDMRIGRLSFDIFGMIVFDEFTITTQTLRPGRTIELIEAVMQSGGKTCIVARAWRMATIDTSAVAGLEDKTATPPQDCQAWQGMKRWSGGYINSLEARIAPNHRPGKGLVWLSNDLNMIEGETYSDFVRLMGMVDTANGTAPRQNVPIDWAFPNLDLQIHLHRLPQGKWLGIDGVQQFGQDGIGITSAILHDEQGPFGRSEQILTLRPMPT